MLEKPIKISRTRKKQSEILFLVVKMLILSLFLRNVLITRTSVYISLLLCLLPILD